MSQLQTENLQLTKSPLQQHVQDAVAAVTIL